MAYFNIDEEINEFEQSRERERDEAHLQTQPEAFATLLTDSAYEPWARPVKVEKVILEGYREDAPGFPLGYQNGFARLIIAKDGSQQPLEFRWDEHGTYPVGFTQPVGIQC